MKPKSKKKRRKALNPKIQKRITIISIVAGTLAGFCYWWFVSRCMHDHCFYHYVPAGEVFLGVFIGWASSATFMNIRDNRLKL